MMKWILYPSFLLACFILLAQPAARAQKHCDLSLSVISPAQGAEIPFGDTVRMVISVKNLGPDNIDSSDAFWLNMENDPFGTHFSNHSIPAGDSLVYVPFYTLSGQNDTDYHLVLCPYLEVDSNTYVDDNPTNDSACMDVILKAKDNTGISMLLAQGEAVRLYPNPARGKISLLMTLKKNAALSVTVQNILGHTVEQERLKARKGKNEFPLNIGHLASGLYFVKIITGDGQSWIDKIIIE